MSLLSLNESTLYYYFLSDRTSNATSKEFSTGINDWAATIPHNAKPASGNKPEAASASTSRMSKLSNRSVPALTNATSRSSNTSVLSKNVKISQNVDVKVKAQAEPHDKSIEIVELGLEDDDEMMGIERDAALKSPPKGKARVSSAVTITKFHPSISVYSLLGYC
jgi:hypothetical protein